MNAMDRVVETAWRAFWLGLGASCVLIAQSLLAPGVTASPASSATTADIVVADEAPIPDPPTLPKTKLHAGYRDPS
jgi:hypothetical protein